MRLIKKKGFPPTLRSMHFVFLSVADKILSFYHCSGFPVLSNEHVVEIKGNGSDFNHEVADTGQEPS